MHQDVESFTSTDSIAETNTYEHLRKQGDLIVKLFDELLKIMETECYKDLARSLSIYRKYIESDKATLVKLGSEYDLSRERIRQLVQKTSRQIIHLHKRAMYISPEYMDRTARIMSALDSIENDVLSLVTHGMPEVSMRKKEAVIRMLFGKDLAQSTIENSVSLTNRIGEESKLAKKKKELVDAWELFRSKICYPSDLKIDRSVTVDTYASAQSFDYVEMFHRKLERFKPMIEIIPNPDVVYYYSNQADIRPHFLLRLADGTSVLVVVTPTLNMAFIYNVNRFNELHQFCKAHGYGYLITDERGHSIYEIMHRNVKADITDRLGAILDNKEMIVWNDIKEIKRSVMITNEDIAAYVLQNKLRFTMTPFCIKRR